jgi:hypothetical protein
MIVIGQGAGIALSSSRRNAIKAPVKVRTKLECKFALIPPSLVHLTISRMELARTIIFIT